MFLKDLTVKIFTHLFITKVYLYKHSGGDTTSLKQNIDFCVSITMDYIIIHIILEIYFEMVK